MLRSSNVSPQRKRKDRPDAWLLTIKPLIPRPLPPGVPEGRGVAGVLRLLFFVFIVDPILSQPKPDRFKVNGILRRDRWHAKLDQQGYSDERLAVIDTVMNALTSCRTGFMGTQLVMTLKNQSRIVLVAIVALAKLTWSCSVA